MKGRRCRKIFRPSSRVQRFSVQGFIFLRAGTRPIVFTVHLVFRRGNPLWLPDTVFGTKLAIAWKNKHL